MLKLFNLIVVVFSLIILTSCDRISVIVENGTGTGSYASKAKILIKSYLPKPGYEFEKWEGDTQYIEDIGSSETYLQLPTLSKDETLEVKVTATYSVDPSAKAYELVVDNGEGSGNYLTYSIINIKANPPETGYEFTKWVGDVEYLNNPYSPSQQIIIKKEDVHLTATYKEIEIPTPTPTLVPTPSLTKVPSLLNHNATFLWEGNKNIWMLSLLSPKLSRTDFQVYILKMKNAGANFCYLALFNEDRNDPWAPYTMYKNNQIGLDIDQAVVDEMKFRLQYIRDQGMGIVLWIRLDDSKNFNATPVERQLKYQEDVVRFFDSYTSGYVTALEANEYMDAASTNYYAGHLRGITTREIGVHLTTGNISHCLQPNIQSCYYQYGFKQNASFIESDTRSKVAQLGGKPFYAAEYHLDSSTAEAKELGDAAMRGGANGTGNNRNMTTTPPPTTGGGEGFNSSITRDYTGEVVSVSHILQRKISFPGVGPDYGKTLMVVWNDGTKLYVSNTATIAIGPNARKFVPGGKYSNNDPQIPTMLVLADRGSSSTQATIYYNK